ncbi:hypothetical protein C366_00872 [Cryptococcus neoformans Tu401-1]|nr:hypothetical protein AYX15_05888 [Cryptococcus neoformans var. grubii]OWZ80465.1 hypothetical protein C365_00937 [Cryptococcus neoformans var. grubii Bt85]OXB39311.1 hypothetical protein J007_00877 [Cryptococcus neoformans var. grubii]OXG22555.1 hypothetical protein C366_00872 [Cryptococcus neoformans var. grubii Tu401-1]OXM81324.1 hypothetical protein C364_00876 [Cryptococcus neoformans var. grubii Bt63]
MTTYALAQHFWRDSEVITISSYDNQLIGTFPLNFIKRGGLNTWAFVSDIVHQLVDIVGGGFIRAKNGNPVLLQEAPYAGDFVFVPHNERASISFARGPEFFRKNIAPNPDGSQSTRSNSKRSTAQQAEFRVALIARDFSCLITDEPYTKCTPCHIIPQSRPDIYRDILSIRYPPPMFAASAGLLLQDDIHHAFDRLELSFYFQDGVYYVHFFVLRTRTARELHGKALRSDRFRGEEEDRPEPRFLKWHYNQCIKARIRGFAAGMELPNTSSEAVIMSTNASP